MKKKTSANVANQSNERQITIERVYHEQHEQKMLILLIKSRLDRFFHWCSRRADVDTYVVFGVLNGLLLFLQKSPFLFWICRLLSVR